MIWDNHTRDEAALFDDVFRSIVAQPWFGKSAAEKEWLARQILGFYRSGVTDPVDLWSITHRRAVSRFSSDAR